MFRITLSMNFDAPYKSHSIIDFRRRSRMTMSHFLRDYLYIPLSGSRAGTSQRYRNLAITMTLRGTSKVVAGLNGIALPKQSAGILDRMSWLVSSANISFDKLFANELSRTCSGHRYSPSSRLSEDEYRSNTLKIKQFFTSDVYLPAPLTAVSVRYR